MSQDQQLRHIGYSWIGDQMHNTTEFQLSNFPVLSSGCYANQSDYIHIEWDLHGGRAEIQMVVEASVEQTSQAIWSLNQVFPTIEDTKTGRFKVCLYSIYFIINSNVRVYIMGKIPYLK